MVGLCGVVLTQCLAGAAGADAKVPLSHIPGVLRELEAERADLQSSLSALPKLNDALQLEAYGFHGGFKPALQELPKEPRWTLDFHFKDYFKAARIILVPSVDHRFGRLGSYGFPKRFRVLDVSPDGSERIIKEWMTEDCPDPGRYPVVLDVPHPGGKHIRIDVYRGASEGEEEFLALDELFGIMGGADHDCDRVTVSSEYEAPPYWARRYVFDHKSSLGLPVGIRTNHAAPLNDFIVQFDEEPEEGCVIELDLGKNCRLGWVTLFPAQSDESIKVPGFGFPADIQLSFVRETAQGTRSNPRQFPKKWGLKRPGNNVVRLPGSDLAGRWLRIHCSKLPRQNGKPTLALGEIHVYRLNETYPVQAVKLEGFSVETESSAQLLVDGYAGGHPIMFLVDWLEQIKQRYVLTEKLDRNTETYAQLQVRWKTFWRVAAYLVMSLIALGALAVALTTILLRKKAVRDLKWRITRDLHDDVGSSLGSISLTAERLEQDVGDSHVKEDLCDLALLAREASASLREVVWVIDQDEIRLPALVQKLTDRAERVLSGKELKLDISGDIVDQVVPLSFKRHLIMFFKEIIHNCARHSGADRVMIHISVKDEAFFLRVVDNGCGFNRADVVDGWGLASLEQRAEELEGSMLIESAPGKGTTIELSVPLKSLFTNLDHQYKTSN